MMPLEAKGNMDNLLASLVNYRISIAPLYPVASILPGEWDSEYSGEGFEFDSLRDYHVGDNIKRINPRITARRGVPTIVNRITPRDLTVVIYCDTSPSMRLRDKYAAQFNAVAMLLFSAYKCESSFELVSLGDWNKHLRPRRGERQFFSLYQTLKGLQEKNVERDFFSALYHHLFRSIQPHSIVFVISDFLGGSAPSNREDRMLRRLADRYDIIPVIVQDDLEYSFPTLSISFGFAVHDEETKQQQALWLSPEDQREIREAHKKRFALLQAGFYSAGIQSMHVDSHNPNEIFKVFSSFFVHRKSQQKHR